MSDVDEARARADEAGELGRSLAEVWLLELAATDDIGPEVMREVVAKLTAIRAKQNDAIRYLVRHLSRSDNNAEK